MVQNEPTLLIKSDKCSQSKLHKESLATILNLRKTSTKVSSSLPIHCRTSINKSKTLLQLRTLYDQMSKLSWLKDNSNEEKIESHYEVTFTKQPWDILLKQPQVKINFLKISHQ